MGPYFGSCRPQKFENFSKSRFRDAESSSASRYPVEEIGYHPAVEIRPVDYGDEQVLALLRVHLDGMHANSPAGTVHALDLSALQHTSVTFVGLWDGDALLAFGALKELSAVHGEIKSMRTAAAHLRRGAANRVLDHLVSLAGERGYRRVSLETGTGPAFEPAIALYHRYGFRTGPAFGDYTASDFNQFMYLAL